MSIEAKSGRRAPILPTMTVRQVAMDYPACRPIFQRHGERERDAAKFGHLESLSRFAQRRGIALDLLLAELSQAAGVEIGRDDPTAGHAHRPFVTTALLITLSLGAGWGMLLLFEIGRERSSDAVSASQIVAHGQTQLWGFIAPFIIGIAVAFLPRTTASPRPSRLLLNLLLGTLLAGILSGFVWSLVARHAAGLGLIGDAAQLAAATGFLLLIRRQLSGKLGISWARFVLAAAAWMIAWAIADLIFRGLAGADGPGAYTDSARRLLMELAIFGFAMNAVYGFGQRLLPGMLGGGAPKARAIEATFRLHNLGILALAASCLGAPTVFAALGALAITSGAVAWAIGLQGFRSTRRSAPRPEAGSPFLVRYIQLAFFWLLAGLALLLAGELAHTFRGVAPPKAYLGATRHALTVGFLTTLILGIGQRLLPILSHDLLAWPKLVVPTFALIAIGNTLRVTLQLATIVWPAVYRILPISALFELTALSLFTANAIRTLWPRKDPLLRTGQVTPMTRAAILMAEHTWLEDILIARGIRYLARVRSIPNELTLRSLAIGEGFDPEPLIADVNRMLAEQPRPGNPESTETNQAQSNKNETHPKSV